MKEIIILSMMLFCSLNKLSAHVFQVGVGKSQIQVPLRGNRMMGYSEASQISSGMIDSLFSRSFFAKDEKGNSLWFTVIDTLSVSENLKLKALEILKKEPNFSKGQISKKNWMIMATHTHSAPGGYDPFDMYNYAAGGFSEDIESAIINSIVESIKTALHSSDFGHLTISQGRLSGITYNRSLGPYLKNKDFLDYEHKTEDQISQLNFFGPDGLIGILNFYAVHGTSLRNKNKLISGDNKGYAAWLVEESKEIIAGFANSNAGDASPNIKSIRHKDSFARMKYIGEKQALKSIEMVSDNFFQIKVNSLKSFYKEEVMEDYRVSKNYTQSGYNETICSPAIGISTLAGTEDGRGLPFKLGVREGMSHSHKRFFPSAWLTSLFLPLELKGYKKKMTRPILTLIAKRPKELNDVDNCHGEKIVIGELKSVHGYGAPNLIPFQVFQLDDHFILGLPGEYTTMAGRRLRRSIKNELELPLTSQVILGGYANSFTSYITTTEEYNEQHYEGSSTLFGPNTAAAHRQIFHNLITGKFQSSTSVTKVLHFYPEPFKKNKITKLKKDSTDFSNSKFKLIKNKIKSFYRKGRDKRIKLVIETKDPLKENSYISLENILTERVFDSTSPIISTEYIHGKKRMKKLKVFIDLTHLVPGDYLLEIQQGNRLEKIGLAILN